MRPFASADEVNDQIVGSIGEMLAGLYHLIEPIFPIIGFFVVLAFVVRFIFAKKRSF